MSGTYEDDPTFPAEPDPLEQSLAADGLALPEEAAPPPVYRMMPDSRIPVNSKRGGV